MHETIAPRGESPLASILARIKLLGLYETAGILRDGQVLVELDSLQVFEPEDFTVDRVRGGIMLRKAVVCEIFGDGETLAAELNRAAEIVSAQLGCDGYLAVAGAVGALVRWPARPLIASELPFVHSDRRREAQWKAERRGRRA